MSLKRHKLLNNLSFTMSYVPSTLAKVFKYCILGSLIGYASGFVLSASLSEYANKKPNEVDFTGQYVRDEEQFLHFSRGANNRITPPISDFLPIYSTLLGAGAGLLFSMSTIKCDYLKRSEEQSINEAVCLSV